MVPLDMSKIAESVLSYAVEIAAKLGSRLHLVTVHESVPAAMKRSCQTYLERVTEGVRVCRRARRVRKYRAEY